MQWEPFYHAVQWDVAVKDKLPGVGGSHGFVSYSHEDRKMVEQLQKHLAPIARFGLLSDLWLDHSLATGDTWSAEIAGRIDSSDIFVICLSAHYIASEYIYSVELRAILRRYEAVHGLILPVVLRPCSWWGFVEDFQAVPIWHGRIRPISMWKPVELGYRTAAEQIRAALERHFGLTTTTETLPDPPPLRKSPPWPTLSYQGPDRLSDDAIDRAVQSVLAKRTPRRDA